MNRNSSGRHFLQIPGPSNVPDRILHAIAQPTIDHRGPEFREISKEALTGIKRIFKSDGPVVIFPTSGTGAWEAALVNTLDPGDRVLMFETGHFATLWCSMARTFGLEVDFVPTNWRHGVDPQIVEDKLKADTDHRIKSVNIVHNETSTGVTSRVAEIREAIDNAKHPAMLMVDTISSLGSVDYQHQKWSVDVTVGCSQKGLMLPPGLGFNAISEKALEKSRSNGFRRHFWDWSEMLQANENFFYPSTPATNLLFGLCEAINILEEEGLENVFTRHARFGEATRRAVSHWGLEILCENPEEYSPVLTAVIMPDGSGADDLRRLILERFNMSLGNGLGKVADRVFRIGHLGDLNDLSLVGTLAGVEMGLRLGSIEHQPGGGGCGNELFKRTRIVSRAMTVKAKAITAHDAVPRIASGEYSSEQLVSDYLKQIDSQEELVGAWAYLDSASALQQARAVDARVAAGETGHLALAGIPVGIKDIFDTHDMVTENGTSADAGRQPNRDAAVVHALRQAGAVIMGKTVTAELAVYTPGKTVNPHDPLRTPGGSSSGSAAAVAAGMVPLAVGTQTNGSVIRPASYCGVVGFKPTMGTIPRNGILKQAPSLDQVGVFAKNVLDSALIAAVLMQEPEGSLKSTPHQVIDPLKVAEHATRKPRLGFCKTPVWLETTERTRKACLDFIDRIGEDVAEFELPDICDHAIPCHRTIMLYEMSQNYRRYMADHRDKVSEALLDMLIEGQGIPMSAYLDAKDQAMEIGGRIDDILGDFDAVLTPATLSEAPVGLESTGSPLCCTIWSLCGVPALSLPVLTGADHMPLGLQLVGPLGTDCKFLGAAEWLWKSCQTTA